MNHRCDLNVRICTKHWSFFGSQASAFAVGSVNWRLFLFFEVGSLCGTAALKDLTSWNNFQVAAFQPVPMHIESRKIVVFMSRTKAVTDGKFQVTFNSWNLKEARTKASLMMLCYSVLHVLTEILCAFAFCMSWELLHWRDAVTSWPLGSWRKPRTKSSFSSLQFWNLKEASHESFVFICSTTGIWKKPRTKASFSSLQLLEFEGSLARKLRFHESWCDLNVRICTKHCVFSGKRRFRCGEKLARARRSQASPLLP